MSIIKIEILMVTVEALVGECKGEEDRKVMVNNVVSAIR